jgi:thiol-disulfide isomerase/thioredoxin
MRRGTWRIGAVVACALGIALPSLAFGQGSKKDDAKNDTKEIAWAKSYDEAVKAARKANKPIMIDFYTVWCPPCKRLDKETYTDEKVIKASDLFVSLKLDAEKEGEHLAGKLGVDAYPTILFLDPKTANEDGGELVGKIVGFEPGAPFAEKMNTIAGSFHDFPKLQERVKKDAGDLEAAGKLILAYCGRENDKEASRLVADAEKKDPKNAKGYLTKGYNALADIYQSRGTSFMQQARQAQQQGDTDEAKGLRDKGAKLLEQAIPVFRKAADTGKDPADVYYARASIAVCLLTEGKFAESLKEYEAAQKVEGAPADQKQQGEMTIQQLKQALKAQGNKADDDDK